MNSNLIAARAKAYKDIEGIINTRIDLARQIVELYAEDPDMTQELKDQIDAYDEAKQALQKAFEASP